MAEESKDLIFPMRLDVDLDKFQQDWKQHELDIQKIIDKTQFKLNISVDGDATKIIQVGEDIGKATKEAEVLIGTLRAMRNEANSLSNQSLDLNIDEQSAEIKQLILDARRLRSEMEGYQLAPMSLGEIGKIGGSQPTGLDLKQRKKELELYLLAEKEGTDNAIRANRELAEVKERLRNLVGKQESALKNTDEEKRVTSTIAAYKKLGDEIDRITAKARERVSRQSGMVIEPSAMTPDMFTSNEKAAIDQLRLSMDAYKASIDEANHAKLNPSALEASKREVALNRENEAIRKAIADDTKKQEAALKALESAYKREEDTVSRIQIKIAQIEKMKPKIAFDATGSAKLDSELTRLRGKLQSMMSPTDALKMKLKELDVEWGKLSANERASAKGREVIKKFNELSQAANGATSSLRAAANAQSRLDAAALKSKYSLDLSSESVKKHNGLLNGMPQFINAYVSVLGAYRISKNIIDTTAEFEMQRVALNAIIQDKRKADELFSQVVELGIRSPFQIKELITYTKQLAAFRVETDKLFSTTKMLADISAGLGVGMDRLILAFGQVRAASVLRGQELRQFTEAGIPLIELLADKVSIMNGELTTTGDIFSMISKRQISFEMIEEVFEDMTKAGGTFYNMQEVMADTLKGQISNLRDAYDKMFMEMGESETDTVKLILRGARSIAENWKEVTDAIGAGVVAYGAYRLAMVATNALVGKSAVATMNLVKAKKMEEVNNLLVAKSYRQLTTAERFMLQTNKEVSASDYKRAIMSKKLNGEDLLRLVALKKIKPEMAKRIIDTSMLTDAEKALFLEQVKVNAAQIDYAAGLGLFRVTTLRLGAAIKGVVLNLKAMSMAFLTNPMTWIMAIGGGLAMLGSKIAGFRTKYSDLEKTLRDKTGALASEMGEAWKNIAETVGKGFEAGATDEVMFSARKEMENILRKNELLSNVIDQRLQSLTSEKAKLDEIKDVWEEITNLSSDNPFVGGQKATGSIVNKDVVQNVEKVEEAYQKAYDILVKASKTMNVTPIKTQLEDIRNQLSEGTISAKGFSDAILNIRKEMVSQGLANTDLYVPFGTALGKMEQSMTTFQKDWDTFLRESIAGMETINGEQPVFGADNFGLSEENLKIFKTRVSTMFDAWLLAQEGMGNVSKAMMRNQAITGLMLTGVEPPEGKLSKFGEWYNKQLSNPNLSLAGKKMELGKERTESEVGEELSKSLTQNKADLERYQRQVLAGVDINKEEVESLRNVIKAQEELSRLLGLKEKGESKTNPRIAELETELDLIKTAYNKYQDLIEVMPESQAKEKVRQMYGSGTPLAFSFGDMDKEYERIIRELESLGKDASKAAHKAFMSQSEDGIKEVVDSVTKDLKDVLDGVDSAMKGQDVYQKMLGLTGNANVAKGLTEAMGLTTKSVRSVVSSAIEDIMGKGVVASDENIENLPKKQAETVRKLMDGLRKYEEAELNTAMSGLDNFLSAEERKVIIAQDTERKIAAIRNSAMSATEQDKWVGALKRKGDADQAGVDLEVLMQSETFIKAFQDLDRVGTKTLENIRADLTKVASSGQLSATNLKKVEDQIQKITAKLEGKNPFSTLISSMDEYRVAIAELSNAQSEYGVQSEQYATAQDKVFEASDKVGGSLKTMESELSDAASSIKSVINASEILAEAFGLTFSDETQEYLDAFNKGMEFASVAVGILSVAFGVLSVAAAPFTIIALAITAALGIMFMKIKLITDLINLSSDKKLKAIEKSIGKVTDRLEELKLAEDDVIGGAYTSNMKEQIEANEELIKLEQERIEEAKKHRNFLGFKAPDKEQIEESTNAIKDYTAEIERLQKTTMNYLTGYDSAISAADAISSAWYDAWLSTGDTMDAITDKFDEMIDNMIVKQLLAQMVAIKLGKVFDFIEKSYENDGMLDMGEIATIQGMLSGMGEGLNSDLSKIMGDWLKAGGTDRRGEDKDLTGISASVQSMSEDTAITLGGYFNSNLVQLLRQTQLLQIIAARDIETPLKDLHGLQQQSLMALNGIKNDTVLMVGHLSRLVQTQQDLMIRGGSKAVNVHLVN